MHALLAYLRRFNSINIPFKILSELFTESGVSEASKNLAQDVLIVISKSCYSLEQDALEFMYNIILHYGWDTMAEVVISYKSISKMEPLRDSILSLRFYFKLLALLDRDAIMLPGQISTKDAGKKLALVVMTTACNILDVEKDLLQLSVLRLDRIGHNGVDEIMGSMVYKLEKGYSNLSCAIEFKLALAGFGDGNSEIDKTRNEFTCDALKHAIKSDISQLRNEEIVHLLGLECKQQINLPYCKKLLQKLSELPIEREFAIIKLIHDTGGDFDEVFCTEAMSKLLLKLLKVMRIDEDQGLSFKLLCTYVFGNVKELDMELSSSNISNLEKLAQASSLPNKLNLALEFYSLVRDIRGLQDAEPIASAIIHAWNDVEFIDTSQDESNQTCLLSYMKMMLEYPVKNVDYVKSFVEKCIPIPSHLVIEIFEIIPVQMLRGPIKESAAKLIKSWVESLDIVKFTTKYIMKLISLILRSQCEGAMNHLVEKVLDTTRKSSLQESVLLALRGVFMEKEVVALLHICSELQITFFYFQLLLGY